MEKTTDWKEQNMRELRSANMLFMGALYRTSPALLLQYVRRMISAIEGTGGKVPKNHAFRVLERGLIKQGVKVDAKPRRS